MQLLALGTHLDAYLTVESAILHKENSSNNHPPPTPFGGPSEAPPSSPKFIRHTLTRQVTVTTGLAD